MDIINYNRSNSRKLVFFATGSVASVDTLEGWSSNSDILVRSSGRSNPVGNSPNISQNVCKKVQLEVKRRSV